MGDANVRRPVATRFERGVDFGLLVHKSPFMADQRDPLVLSNYVPFVNRPLESEIHGTVNFTQFCCVLLVTWCYRVLLSCYLRPK